MRRGFSLAELMVALALAAGPLLVALHLIQSNVRAARFNKERATARLVLQDLTDLLLGETLQTLDSLAGDRAALEKALDERIAAMPESARTPCAEQARGLRGKLALALEPDLGGDAPGLARLTLTAELERGQTLRLVRLFRPAARVPP